MSDFRRHDKIQLWLNRPVPWNAASCYMESPTVTGGWILGSTLIAGVHRFVSAPLPKPLTRHVSLTWIYLAPMSKLSYRSRLTRAIIRSPWWLSL